jgi:hypothetical protein
VVCFIKKDDDGDGDDDDEYACAWDDDECTGG